ncbi:hypothetical protein ACEWAY_22885, partial [Vibrio parahaemolyticus]
KSDGGQPSPTPPTQPSTTPLQDPSKTTSTCPDGTTTCLSQPASLTKDAGVNASYFTGKAKDASSSATSP